MARIANVYEEKREYTEGNLSILGSTLLYLELVSERVSMAARTGHQAMLYPAIDDIKQAERLVKLVQQRICVRYQESGDKS